MKFKLILLTLPFLLFSFKPNKSLKKISKLYSYVPAGYVLHNYSRSSGKFQMDSLGAFMISPTEVTNFQYKEFLYSLKNDSQAYWENYPDTTVWEGSMLYSGPMTVNYFAHPAYRDFPVVGVSLKQAKNYCKWLTKALAVTFPEANVKARLPNKLEFIRASRGDKQYYYSHGIRLQDRKGRYLYNYKRIGDEQISYNSRKKSFKIVQTPFPNNFDGALLTVQAKSYNANEFGVYNLNGNVAELIGDFNMAMGGSWNSTGYDIRTESFVPYRGPSAEIGFRVVLEITQ